MGVRFGKELYGNQNLALVSPPCEAGGRVKTETRALEPPARRTTGPTVRGPRVA